ncbi:MAG: hypothetical protein EZS28_003834 [Streblomastix strix]|uniref:Uncharacterized protein n=2 Tax=Streblomastix strix TaxID=222440 RepID=A0A5J4X0R0_9EUKA|nr:MAG: hypothetical protein EZS28_003834 [Streblomastix strix]
MVSFLHIKDIAALCLGNLFKSREIYDPFMRQDFITYLKQLATEDNWAKKEARLTLKYLAQNEANRAVIEQGGFTIPE